MAQACLGVLLRLDSSMNRRTIDGYPLAWYAGQHFGDHVEFENMLPHVTEGVDNLLDLDKPHFDTWVWLQIGDWNADTWYTSNMNNDYPGHFPPPPFPKSHSQVPTAGIPLVLRCSVWTLLSCTSPHFEVPTGPTCHGR